ncbi:MAG: hypothetical protein ABJG15_10525 [Hyphomonadaceae bacterium]
MGNTSYQQAITSAATPDTRLGIAQKDKYSAAIELYENLTRFTGNISADTSGDGEFDLEIYQSLQLSRACMLRWIAINSPTKSKTEYIRKLIVQSAVRDDDKND